MSVKLWFKRRKAANIKLDGATQQLLDLRLQIKEREIELGNANIELEQQRKRQSFMIEEEQHRHKLTLESTKAAFARKEELWKEDKEKLLRNVEEEKQKFKASLQADHDITTRELQSLLKVKGEQDIIQSQVNHDRKIAELEAKHNKALSELETRNSVTHSELVSAHAKELSKTQIEISQKYHDQLGAALTKMHSEGNDSTKFLKDIALELATKMPIRPDHAEMKFIPANLSMPGT